MMPDRVGIEGGKKGLYEEVTDLEGERRERGGENMKGGYHKELNGWEGDENDGEEYSQYT